MKLTPLQNDRAAGVLIAQAAGDALGAGYEFDAPMPDGAPVAMIGGGPFGFEPAEWTDDTSMALVIAEALLDAPAHTLDATAKDAIVRGWAEWAPRPATSERRPSRPCGARRLAAAAGRTAPNAADALGPPSRCI